MPARNLASRSATVRPLKSALFALASLSALLAGCTMAPKYQRPIAPVPQSWPQGDAYPASEAAQTAAPDLAWRDFFTDPKMREVIGLALDNNRNLRVALLNIQAARAQYHIQRSALFPTLDGGANGTYEHTPLGFGSVSTTPGSATSGSGLSGGGVGATGGIGTSAGSAFSSSEFLRIYSVDAGISNYELDLWGRVRSLTKAALEQYLSTAEAQRSTRISLISEVATDDLTLAADLEHLRVAKATLENDQKTLDLTRAKFNGGVASELDVRQAETAVDQSRADISTYTTQAAQDRNALNLVVGESVPDNLLPTGLDDTLPTLADIPAGLSSDILLRRPDVMQAEHTLKANNADIGAARAAFFPTITMTASGGTTSLSMTSLFSSGSGTWTISPSLTVPIFDWGKNKASLKYAKVQQKVAAAQYEYAIQTAFREVSDALAQRGTIAELLSARQANVEAASGSLHLSVARYQRGTDPYLNTLSSELTLYTAQQNLIAAKQTRATNLVTLYRTLGGGVK
ncbi:MAG: efflux transporter outer membrane subunit [Caulobacteraceae bacterium]